MSTGGEHAAILEQKRPDDEKALVLKILTARTW